MLQGIYRGTRSKLYGEKALVQVYTDHVTAQFDHWETGMAFGWHRFESTDFEILPNPFADEPV